METRFIEIDAEKSPFLCEHLSVMCLPSLILAVNNKVDRQVIGLHPFRFKTQRGSNEIIMETHKIEEALIRWKVLEEPAIFAQQAAAAEQSDDEDSSDLDL